MIRTSVMTVSRWIVAALLGAVLIASPLWAQDNLVANGSFELDTDGNGGPDDWATSGTTGIEQTLTVDAGPDGTKAGKLVCTRFVGGSPASHAMVCQSGQVAVKAGQWYRLTWRAKARDMRINAVQVDDDPYRTPQVVGDAAMSKCVWPSEREAAQALVQSAAVFCTHGLRKIFLHAGSCGPINGSSAGGVFFEYGGTPRKMLPAVSAFSRLLDADFEPVDTGPQPADMRVYVFKVKRGLLAIAWTREDKPVCVTASGDITVIDIMGNAISERAVELTATPVYFLTRTLTPEELKSILSKRQ